MTQDEFNAMLAIAIAQNLGGGYYTSQYSGEEIDTLLGMTSYAAGSTVISNITTTVTEANTQAQAAAASAAEDAQAIEDLTVSSTTLAHDADPTVTKTLVGGVYNLDFGLPASETVTYTDPDDDGNVVITAV